MRRLWLTFVAVLIGGAGAVHAQAQTYPNRPVRIIVPYAPGGGVSILAQIVGNKMSELMKQPMVVATQYVIGGSLKHPATTLRELAVDAKARPGILNYGSSGPGSTLHLLAEMFKAIAGVDIVHIPYRG